MPLPEISSSYPATREALRTVASYVIAPSLRQVTGRIRLAPLPRGFGTAAFGGGRRVRVEASAEAVCLVIEEHGVEQRHSLTTVRELAEAVGVTPSPDPGVGKDLPAFAPDEPLDVDPASALAAAAALALGEAVLGDLRYALAARGPVSDLVLWPEHFDLGFSLDAPGLRAANYGLSPGDASSPEPYFYVGPWDTGLLAGAPTDGSSPWNASFGAVLGWSELTAAPSPSAHARAWLDRVLTHLEGPAEA